MELSELIHLDPWDWPEGTDGLILTVLKDREKNTQDRILAAQMGGEINVINNDLAETLLDIVKNGDEPRELRQQAAISLGPALEEMDMGLMDDLEEMPIDEDTFDRIKSVFHQFYQDPSVPRDVRRRILEASVRADQDWHEQAIQEAWESEDQDWNLTAVFCMIFVPGFENEIMKALESQDEMIRFHAVEAAGNWELEAAWPKISGLAKSSDTGKSLRLAAIEALGNLRPRDSQPILEELTKEQDQEIRDAAFESLGMAESSLGLFDEDTRY